MATTVTWRISTSASALHAARAVLRGDVFADVDLAIALAEPAALLQEEVQLALLPAEKFWQNLLGLASNYENNRELANLSLTKTVGRTATAAVTSQRIASAIAAVEAAFLRHLPRLAEELPLRAGPLKEQWEARGPGFLHQVELFTDPALLVEQAEVVVVHPALGGGGEAWLAGNQVRIEGVLANPLPHLPEVVRLGWLIAQLNLDLPSLSENVPAERVPRAAKVALLPAALEAGKAVELCQDSPELIAQAMGAWNVAADAVLVAQWWETYRESHPPFAVALAALDQMLS
jgi:hypothetical protein